MQALLRGAGTSANEAPIRAADELLASARIGHEEELAVQLREVEIGYWRWAQAVRAVDIRRASLKLAETQRDRTAELIRRGRQADTDALLAEQIVADRQDALAVAINEAANRHEALLMLMGYPYAEMPKSEADPEEFPEIDPKIEPIDDLLQQARGGSYSMRRLAHERTALEQELRASEARAGPSSTPSAPSGSRAATAPWAPPTPRPCAARPTSGSAACASPTRSAATRPWPKPERLQAKLVSEQNSVEQANRQTDLAIVSARRELELGLSRISLATLAKRLATEKLRAEEERYTIGRTTMQNVRQFQEDLDQAGLRELEARVGFLAARAQLDFLVGRFLASRGLMKSAAR